MADVSGLPGPDDRDAGRVITHLPLEGEGGGGWGGSAVVQTRRVGRRRADGAHPRLLGNSVPPPLPTLPLEGRAFAYGRGRKSRRCGAVCGFFSRDERVRV